MGNSIFKEPPKEEEPKNKVVAIPEIRPRFTVDRELSRKIRTENPDMVRDIESVLAKTLSKYSKATPEEISKFFNTKLPMVLITYLDVILIVLDEKESGVERSFKITPIIPKIDEKKADKLASELQKGLSNYNQFIHVDIFSEGNEVKISFSIVPPEESTIDLEDETINP